MNAATNMENATVRNGVLEGPAALTGMMELAMAICNLLEGENEEGRVALCYATLNRLRRFGCADEAAGTRWAAARKRDIFDPALSRALAVACLVLAGEIKDPTEGATHFHLHTERPSWAWSARPKALIGRYLFYTVEQECASERMD